MITVTIKYGVTSEITKEFNENTVGSVVTANIKGLLGAPENVKVVRDSETLSSRDVLYDGDIVYLETQACEKQ